MKTSSALQLLESVVAEGIGAHEVAVAALVDRAVRCGLRPALVAAVADADGPPVARERALGRLVGQLLDQPALASIDPRTPHLQAA